MTASAGDQITYNLTAYNSGAATVSNFVMQDDLSYVTDYASIIDDQGATINSNGIMSWAPTNIAAGSTYTKTITVMIKNPIPNTPPSSSDPELFDHIMTNVYGNTINIKLPQNSLTAVESTNTALPNTGPGSSLIIVAALTLVIGYFFARSRLISIESSVAIKNNNGGAI